MICCEYRLRHLSSSRYIGLGMRLRHLEKNSASGERAETLRSCLPFSSLRLALRFCQ